MSSSKVGGLAARQVVGARPEGGGNGPTTPMSRANLVSVDARRNDGIGIGRRRHKDEASVSTSMRNLLGNIPTDRHSGTGPTEDHGQGTITTEPSTPSLRRSDDGALEGSARHQLLSSPITDISADLDDNAKKLNESLPDDIKKGMNAVLKSDRRPKSLRKATSIEAKKMAKGAQNVAKDAAKTLGLITTKDQKRKRANLPAKVADNLYDFQIAEVCADIGKVSSASSRRLNKVRGMRSWINSKDYEKKPGMYLGGFVAAQREIIPFGDKFAGALKQVVERDVCDKIYDIIVAANKRDSVDYKAPDIEKNFKGITEFAKTLGNADRKEDMLIYIAGARRAFENF